MIDFEKPVEAVHTDGRVMPVTDVHPWANDQWPHCGVADKEHIYLRSDGRCSRGSWGDMERWTLRNVKEPTMRTAHEHLDRMEAFVRKCANGIGLHTRDNGGIGAVSAEAEAKAIIAAIDGPTTDEEWAEKLTRESHWHNYGTGDTSVRALVTRAIAKGRELARNEQANPDFGRE